MKHGRPSLIAHCSSLIVHHFPFILLLAYCGIVFDGILFMTRGLVGPDGFLYARYACMLPERGLVRTFPWLRFTALNDAFWDNKLLYHVFLMPFCRLAGEPLVGAKVATLVLELGVLTVFYALLRRLKVPWPLLWVAALVVGNALFLNRLLMVRPHVLSMILMLLALYAVIRQRFWASFGIAFLYVWSYSAPLAVLVTAVAAEIGGLVFLGWPKQHEPAAQTGTRRLPLMSLAVAAGLVAGHLIHPYSPLTLQAFLASLHVTASAAVGSSVELGAEYQPLILRDLAVVMPLMTLAVAGALTCAVLLRCGRIAGRRLSPEAAATLGAALAWCSGMFVFSRVVEYAAPLAILAAGLVFRDLMAGRPCLALAGQPPGARTKTLAAIAVAVLLLGASHEWSLRLVTAVNLASQRHFGSEEAWRRGRYFDGAAAWLKQHVKPKTVVLNFHWDDFPELFYSAPECYYVTGSDPTLLRLFRPDLSALLEDMRTQRTPLDFKCLGQAFQTEYIVMRNYRKNAYPGLRDGIVKPVYADEGAVIYKAASGE